MSFLAEIQPQMPELFLKLLTWAIGGTFSAAVIAVGFTWRASAKVTKIDDALKAHETAANTHADKDEREFSIIAHALDEQGKQFEKLCDRVYESNNTLQQIVASSKVQFESLNSRLERIEDKVGSKL